MEQDDEISPQLLEQLGKLQTADQRDAKAAAAGKVAFLDQANSIKSSVSFNDNRRHNNWNQKTISSHKWFQKERKPVMSTLTAIILAISLLLGGSGITVAAAQSSLPDDLLYDIKLLSEEAYMALQTTPYSQFEVALDLVDRRFAEVTDLYSSGEIPTAETQTRLRDQIERSIVLAINLPEDKIPNAFEQIQTRLQTEQENMAQIQNMGTEQALSVMFQIQNMIQERVQILENGMNAFSQSQNQIGAPEQAGTGQGLFPTGEVGGGNPWTIGTPTPGSSYGPGESNNPWTMDTPIPGSSYGPGDGTGTCLDCTPVNGGVPNGYQSTRTPIQAGGNGGSRK